MNTVRGALVLAVIGLVAMLVVAAFAASGDSPAEGGRPRSRADCGLQRPNRGLQGAELPAFARFRGAEIVSLDASRGFVSALLNAPMSVIDVMDAMRNPMAKAGYTIMHEDFEGFEAELFIKAKEEFGVIRILASRCRHFSTVSFQVPESVSLQR